MEEKQNFIGGIPAQPVEPEKLQEALQGMLKQAAGPGGPALNGFTHFQQRRATRLEDTAKALRSKLGKDHPAVVAAEAMAKSSADLKTRLSAETTRLKRFPKIRPHEWIVFGTVIDEQGKAAAGLTVRVFDRDRKYDDLLGETETDENGDFSVVYHERDFKETREALPELYVMINDASGAEVYSSRDSVRFQSGRSEYFAIRLGSVKLAGVRATRTRKKTAKG